MKDALPAETIAAARKALACIDVRLDTHVRQVKKIDIFNAEVIATIGSSPGLLAAAAGKGMSAASATAGAHGEFMERLQNDMLLDLPLRPTFFLDALKGSSGRSFCYWPEEAAIGGLESLQENAGIYSKMLGSQFTEQRSNLATLLDIHRLHLPFYNLLDGGEKMLPLEIIHMTCSSSGMCAGNTLEEGLVQGLMEILERHACVCLFHQDIAALPEIPIDLTQGHSVYSLVQQLLDENPHLEIRIKDCSLGRALPVVGVLQIDTARQLYKFHLGAGASLSEAVERALTEAYQVSQSPLKSKISTSASPTARAARLPHRIRANMNVLSAIKNEAAEWPEIVLKSGPPSTADAFRRFGSSNSVNLSKLLNWLADRGHEVYVRDNSFLGFSAFHIYVPGLSEFNLYFPLENALGYRKWRSEWPDLFRLSALEVDKKNNLAHALAAFNNLPRAQPLQLSQLVPLQAARQVSLTVREFVEKLPARRGVPQLPSCLTCDCTTAANIGSCAYEMNMAFMKRLEPYKRGHSPLRAKALRTLGQHRFSM